ncbi:MAG TPA: stage V sporulation protein AC [Firmicutes bacterium]|uniref:Stage V sporulation protein AC n=1 Tax=Candidatus Fermentithermobacillus carboniphilus TaxID=3085328 RepID=A0AAT9LEA9_9FIRM|nr:MAG: stage V sporulation protein AC [Candidatus Fermentithermobacillus carboniphilus]HHW17957.1 stage V sporulation protein AC [Candidatus Fermentithermobacillaceae bacterium]
MTKACIREREAYSRLSEDYRPKRPIVRNIILAFVVGGLICVVGQFFLDYLVSRKLAPTQAQAMTSSIMVFLGAFLTGIGVYDKLGRLAGMGAALPITGFANSVVSPAMEFKREGFVLGVSAKMFQVAGPVIVYGSLVSVLVSILRLYIFK